ncbi:putative disease resistance RPP13-like protein 1 [Rutidosis leptorrhynchoides]|uniref:putative disease resistance RPP13-like protein 1 n=1 Tax=Rutidosis leptorrhynchoides TaxID=125765 RepID=UPI003A98EE80
MNLDNVATETMRRNFNDESHGTGEVSVFNIIPNFLTNMADIADNFMYGYNMRPMLNEINNKLKVFVEKAKDLDKSKVVFGREADQEALLNKLLGDEACNQNVSIISIVGLGGVGKTTLAQLLYNNGKVIDEFDLKGWVCVSEEFDVLTISNQIYQAVTGENKNFVNLDQLHVALKEKLSNKRFLIMLDDVWNEDQDKWEVLEKPLKGAPGSKIIVTTRKTTVASVMNCVEPYDLGILSDKDVLSLLAKSALDEHNFYKHQPLISVAQLITEKCKGLPLALIAIGRVLKGKGNDEYEWYKLLKSEIWSSNDSILPALKLSYYDLPSQQKQLFAYCCLFPKDYRFNKKELVLLWMAEGFLNQPNGNMSMESVGFEYFEELQARSFFQQLTGKESKYTMHDLMNDLAISVAGDFFYMLDDKMDVNARNEAFKKFRHNSYLGQRGVESGKLMELHRSERLLTYFPNYKTDIIKVPEEVSELYNLQSLLVSHCMKLISLPLSFHKLINLRHLDMTDTPLLNKTPLGMGGLTSLQTLSKGELSISGLEKVTDPQQAMDANLEGKKGLLVSIGENEVNVGSSDRKSVLKEVVLSHCDSLESYNCPNIVEKLHIFYCNSMTSVSMSTTLQELPSSLRSLDVFNCKNLKSFSHEQLQSLTSLEEMRIIRYDSFPCGLWPPNLRSLEIGELKKPMSDWGLQNYPTSLVILRLDGSNSGVTSFAMEGDEMNSDASTSFLLPPSLTFLEIRNFNDVESISEVVQHLTHLQRLYIWKCPNIKDVPQSTSSLTVDVAQY